MGILSDSLTLCVNLTECTAATNPFLTWLSSLVGPLVSYLCLACTCHACPPTPISGTVRSNMTPLILLKYQQGGSIVLSSLTVIHLGNLAFLHYLKSFSRARNSSSLYSSRMLTQLQELSFIVTFLISSFYSAMYTKCRAAPRGHLVFVQFSTASFALLSPGVQLLAAQISVCLLCPDNTLPFGSEQ
jgi:hypothetical protein